MPSTVNASQHTAPVYENIDLGPAGSSVQLMFAALQLSQSRLCKDEAVKRMKEVQDIQGLQKDMAAKLAEARRLQEVAKEKGTAAAGQEFVNFCKANGIGLSPDGKPVTSYKLSDFAKQLLAKYKDDPYVANFLNGRDVNNLSDDDRKKLCRVLSTAARMHEDPVEVTEEKLFTAENKTSFTTKEWESILKTLTDKQELIGGNTQTAMVYLQDFIGQYNSFLQGANSAIATANQVLTSIAKGQ